MYYCFHSCFFKTAASCRQHCWVVGTGGWWVFSYWVGGNSRNWVDGGQLSWGLAHCMANTDPIFWSALQHSIQLDNKYQIRQRHGSRGGFTNYNLFCSLWKTCLDGDQHVHTLLLTHPSTLSKGCIQETLNGANCRLSQACVGYSSKVFHHSLYQRLSLTVLRFTVQFLVVITSEQN